MRKRITIENNEVFLRQISSEVDFVNDDYKTIIKELKDYCINSAVFALAPVQIGIPKRIIYIRNSTPNMDNNLNSSYNEEIIYINPKIISRKGHTKFLEGCESCSYKKGDKAYFYCRNYR